MQIVRSAVRRVLVFLRIIEKPAFVAKYAPTQPSRDSLVDGVVTVVRHDQHEKWACFRCPGCCGEKIMLNLSAKRLPRWRILKDWLFRPTLEPSIWQQNECGCHFWIRSGQVQWCSGGEPKANQSRSDSDP